MKISVIVYLSLKNYNIHIMFSCFHLLEVISCENVTLGKWKQIMQCVSLYVYEIHNLFIFDCSLYKAIIYLSCITQSKMVCKYAWYLYNFFCKFVYTIFSPLIWRT